MATNYAKRASDGRRAINKRGLPTLVYTDGATALALVKNDRPHLKLVTKPLVLIPGVLEVGSGSKLLGTFSVTFAGRHTWMSREQINGLLEVAHLAKSVLPKKQKTAKVETPAVYLLTAVCESTKKLTQPPFTAAA